MNNQGETLAPNSRRTEQSGSERSRTPWKTETETHQEARIAVTWIYDFAGRVVIAFMIIATPRLLSGFSDYSDFSDFPAWRQLATPV